MKTYTVFGKTTIVVNKEIGNPIQEMSFVANSFQLYLVENLGLKNNIAYAIMCLAFGKRHTCGSMPNMTYSEIHLIVMALPDRIEVA